MIDIIELAKKAGALTEVRSSLNVDGDSIVFMPEEVQRFAAIHKQALIDSGELVPAEIHYHDHVSFRKVCEVCQAFEKFKEQP